MKFYLLLLIFLIPFILSADVDPKTIYTEDRFFITSGQVDFTQSVDLVSNTLLKYNNYSEWALQGMQGIDKESEGLIAFFTDISYSVEENVFFVTFDINLIWPFGKKGVVMKFYPHQSFTDTGELESITLVPELESKMVEEAQLNLFIINDNSIVSVAYESQIKLSGFLDFFFSLRSYKKNFEWYIYKVAENLTTYLNKQSF